MCCTHRSQAWRFQLSAEVFTQQTTTSSHSSYLQLTEREQLREGSLKMLLAQSWAGSEPWVCSSSCSVPECAFRGFSQGFVFQETPSAPASAKSTQEFLGAALLLAAGRDVFRGIMESIRLERPSKMKESNH